MKYKLPYFAEIEITRVGEYYDVEIELKGQKTTIDMNFENTALDRRLFDRLKKILDNIEQEDLKNREQIFAAFREENGNTVKSFIEDHISVLEEELSGILSLKDTSCSPEEQLIKELVLYRIGFYPDGKYGSESFAVFDYGVGKELSNQILVVNIDPDGDLIDITWES